MAKEEKKPAKKELTPRRLILGIVILFFTILWTIFVVVPVFIAMYSR